MKTELRPSALLLSSGETPTTDYFLVPHLEKLGYEVKLLDSRFLSLGSAIEGGTCRMVVISRYVSRGWFGILERLRRQGVRLAYFMDDDLLDIRALGGLPWRYRWKIVTCALVHRSRLLRVCDEFWVSTAYLARKYAKFNPVLLDPTPSRKTLEGKPGVRVCYHGTASHQQEIEWLVPIIEAVQARSDDIHFELFGARTLNRKVGMLPRVKVIHPMAWPNYLAFTASEKRDIGLAPLLPGVFNLARSSTKFFDYARMGAVGLYSDVSPYNGFVRDGIDGLLLDNNPVAWIDALLALAQNGQKRESMATAARQRASDMLNIQSEKKRSEPDWRELEKNRTAGHSIK